MKDALKGYPEISGRASPISEAHARELNRVTGALEEEIGVPLDIEWGILDPTTPGWKLYIIQARPIIGNFKKPAVEKSAELKEMTPIAATPSAIGHTSGNGFTGRKGLR